MDCYQTIRTRNRLWGSSVATWPEVVHALGLRAGFCMALKQRQGGWAAVSEHHPKGMQPADQRKAMQNPRKRCPRPTSQESGARIATFFRSPKNLPQSRPIPPENRGGRRLFIENLGHIWCFYRSMRRLWSKISRWSSQDYRQPQRKTGS